MAFLFSLCFDLFASLLLSVELFLLLQEDVLDVLVVDWCSIEYESTVLAVRLLEAVLDEFVECSEVVGEVCFRVA